MEQDIVKRYQEAQDLLQGILTNQMVRNDTVFPCWIEGSAVFWYARQTELGQEFRLVDASSADNILAFDHGCLAASLSEKTGKKITADRLPITNVNIQLSPKLISFQAFDDLWYYDPINDECQKKILEKEIEKSVAPDGRKYIFICDHNLWLSNAGSDRKHAVTQDGTEGFTYASSLIPQLNSEVEAVWSPGSDRFFTWRVDRRHVASRPKSSMCRLIVVYSRN